MSEQPNTIPSKEEIEEARTNARKFAEFVERTDEEGFSNPVFAYFQTRTLKMMHDRQMLFNTPDNPKLKPNDLMVASIEKKLIKDIRAIFYEPQKSFKELLTDIGKEKDDFPLLHAADPLTTDEEGTILDPDTNQPLDGEEAVEDGVALPESHEDEKKKLEEEMDRLSEKVHDLKEEKDKILKAKRKGAKAKAEKLQNQIAGLENEWETNLEAYKSLVRQESQVEEESEKKESEAETPAEEKEGNDEKVVPLKK